MDEDFETPDLSEFLDVLREAVLPVVRQADGTESDGQATGVLLRPMPLGLQQLAAQKTNEGEREWKHQS
jgi:hypothetical protein